MIRNFGDKDTEGLYELRFIRRFAGIERQALRRLRILDSATTLHDLIGLPSNHFEALRGDRQGQYSIRINRYTAVALRPGVFLPAKTPGLKQSEV